MEQSSQPEGDIADVPTDQTDQKKIDTIIDAIVVVQAITTTTTMVNCSAFAQAIIHSIPKIMSGYKEGRVIFDRYIEISDTQ